MTVFLIIVVFVVAAVITLRRGATWAFAWVLIPTFILVAPGIELNLPGLPELSPRRAACLGILIGMVLRGERFKLLPRAGIIDVMIISAVVWFSISFGLLTDLKGFGHKLVVLSMDWLLPYLLTRYLVQSVRSLSIIVGPLAICMAIHGMVAAFEARMIARVGREFWGALTDIPVPGYWLEGGARRWGYLRAVGFFSHPIYIGVLFATLLPLVPLLGIFRQKSVNMVAAAVAGLAGLVASLSRGPWLSFAIASSLYAALTFYRARLILPIGAFVLIALSPFLFEFMGESIDYTKATLEERGNVESGYYRIALFMIYGRRVMEIGWFGEPSIIALDYTAAWSVDNSYLYFFIEGGWGGGGLMLAIVLYQLFVALNSVVRSMGTRRRIRACFAASFTSMAISMVNVWFAPDYAPFFFITVALVTNSRRESFFSAYGFNNMRAGRNYSARPSTGRFGPSNT